MRTPSRRWRIAIIVALASLVVVMAIVRWRARPAPPAPGAPVEVSVARAQSGPIAAEMRGVGAITAVREATLSAKIAGQIARMPLLKNRSVRAGEVLATLESSDLLAQRREAAAAMAEAEAALQAMAGGSIPASMAQDERVVADGRARLDNARRIYERRLQLYADGGISQKDLDASRLDVTTAENELRLAERTLQLRRSTLNATDEQGASARLAMARQRLAYADAQLGYATIRAPFAGIIIDQYQFQGDFITPGTNLLKIADLSRLIVKVAVSDVVANSIAQGDIARVTPSDEPASAIRASVRLVSRGEDPLSRTAEVWIELPGSNGGPRPGGSAEVVLEYGRKASAVTVPESAVVLDATTGNTGAVMVVTASGVASERKVTAGIRAAGRIEIISGIDAGDLVITEGNYGLPDGTKVSVRR